MPTPPVTEAGAEVTKKEERSGLATDGGPEMAELVLDFVRRRDGLGDLIAHQVPEAPSETMHRHLDGTFGRSQVRRGLRVAQLRQVARQVWLQPIELRRLVT